MHRVFLSFNFLSAIALPLLLVLIPASVSANAFERLLAPKAELWERWTAHERADSRQISHASWDAFLQKYVRPGEDRFNRVAYAAVTAADRATLEGYIEDLAGIRISGYTRAEQFAYWVNLYNALTVKVVLDHMPVDSIRDIDISPGFFADGPWRKKLLAVEGEPVSLDDIEHRILRPIWREPRVHYAVNCASVGCPNLQPVAFTAANTESLLAQAARDYVNHARGVSVTADGLVLSSIYNWFAPDFDSDGGVLAHIRSYAEAPLRERLGTLPIVDYTYDWRLNGAR
ncbi:MAG: DUF547 domain-containing protein [Gammaproteobacteria bacterium]|nr:DUF547 domain-containing protein [Gammaproteobacteria bacterium]